MDERRVKGVGMKVRVIGWRDAGVGFRNIGL